MQGKTVINQVLHSSVLTPRQRWIIVRHIKTGELSESELEKIARVIAEEQSYLDKSSVESDEAYQARLKGWVDQLKKIDQTDFKQEIYEEEVSEAKNDEASANAALESLKNL